MRNLPYDLVIHISIFSRPRETRTHTHTTQLCSYAHAPMPYSDTDTLNKWTTTTKHYRARSMTAAIEVALDDRLLWPSMLMLLVITIQCSCSWLMMATKCVYLRYFIARYIELPQSIESCKKTTSMIFMYDIWWVKEKKNNNNNSAIDHWAQSIKKTQQ